jgi:zinc protease
LQPRRPLKTQGPLQPLQPLKASAVNRSAPPPPGEVHPFHFPAFVRHRLPSGVVVWLAQLPGAPLISIDLLAPAGCQHDPPGRAGLATFTAALLDEGAAGRNALEIAAGVEGLGGQIVTGADWDVGYGTIFLLSRHARAGLRLLAEVFATPTFPDREIERLRRLRLSELLRRRHQPSAIADEQLAAALYHGTVYANVPLGTEASLAAIGRDEIVKFYRRHYRLAASNLILVSDLRPDDLLEVAADALAAALSDSDGAGGGDAEAVAQPAIIPPPLAGPRVYIVDRPGAAQTELRLGHAGVPRPHPDSAALSFLNTLLGGKFTSRINLNLRERHGYTYGASSRFSGRLGPGPFVIGTGVATESAGAAAREVLHELRRIQDEPVEADEMEETRSYILGVFPYTVQTIADLARRLADLAIYGLPDDHYDRYLRTVATLSRADIQEAARRHLHPDQSAIVAVGPAELLRPQFESFAEVIVRAISSADS